MIIFVTLLFFGKEIQQQMEEVTIICVQIRYKSHRGKENSLPAIPKHMADMCLLEYQEMTNTWRFVK